MICFACNTPTELDTVDFCTPECAEAWVRATEPALVLVHAVASATRAPDELERDPVLEACIEAITTYPTWH